MLVRTMTREAAAQTDGRNDGELIDAIARQRDQSAIAELLRRYQGEAYALALRIVGNCESAEDIVQEAMVRVWTTAASYRGDGPVRAWLMRIIARQSINTFKKMKRISAKVKTDWAERGDEGPNPEVQIESSELVSALRREFERLPELDRQMIGLHYGGGLTQQEISEELSMPQQTVSNHLNRTLKSLRSALSIAGYVAIPLAMTEGIGEALCSGAQPSSGFQRRVLERIAANKSIRGNRNSVRKTRSSSWVARAGAAVVLGAGIVLWIAFARATPVQSPAAVSPGAPAASDAPYDWHKQWTFEHGVPADFIVSPNSTWTWNPATNALDAAGTAEFAFNRRMPAAPLMITMKCRFFDLAHDFNFGEKLVLKEALKNAELQQRNENNYHHDVGSAELDRKLYIYKNYFVTVINGKLCSASKLETTAEGNIVLFSIQNLSVKEIDVTPLKEDEVPDFVKDPKTFQ